MNTKEELATHSVQPTTMVADALSNPHDYFLTYSTPGASLSKIGSEFSLLITMNEFDRVRDAMDKQ